MTRLALSLMLGLALAPAATFAQSRADNIVAHDTIDRFVEQEMAAQKIPGVALAIMRNGAPIKLQGYGYANIEHQVPVHADTIFQSGSIGKMFTGMAVMLLVEDGKLDLDASIRTYLPDAPASWAPIKLRHLLNHTGGLGDPDLDYRREYTDEDLLQAYYAVPQLFPAARRWSYSNTGYATLGIIVRKAGGEFYGDVLAKRVFAPLGMRTARVISDEAIVPNRSAGYYVGDEGDYTNQPFVSKSLNATADGSLYLSALDYVNWEDGVRRKALLKPESWKEITRPAPLDNGTTYPYGFGWMLAKAPNGGEIMQHSGSWQGFRTNLRRYIDDGVTILILANSTSADTGKLLNGVASRYDSRYTEPAPAKIADAHPDLTASTSRTLARVAAGTLTDKDFPLIDGEWRQRMFDSGRKTLGELGKCGNLDVFSDQANGDRQVRRYQAQCRNGVLEASSTMAADGTPDTLSVRRRTPGQAADED
jgi:CubicO group peptidase (beta-lactamase class C family)